MGDGSLEHTIGVGQVVEQVVDDPIVNGGSHRLQMLWTGDVAGRMR